MSYTATIGTRRQIVIPKAVENSFKKNALRRGTKIRVSVRNNKIILEPQADPIEALCGIWKNSTGNTEELRTKFREKEEKHEKKILNILQKKNKNI